MINVHTALFPAAGLGWLTTHLRLATALSEIVVGTLAQLIIGIVIGSALPAGDSTWLKFLSGAGAILLAISAEFHMTSGCTATRIGGFAAGRRAVLVVRQENGSDELQTTGARLPS